MKIRYRGAVSVLCVGLFWAASSFYQPVSAISLTQIGDGQKCGKLNNIRNDGIFYYLCVKQGRKKVWKIQGRIGPSPTATQTSLAITTTTTTVAPRKPPSGDYWEKQSLNSSNILMYGNPYRIFLCTNGSADSVLTLWVNVLNTWVKRVDSFGATSDSLCSGEYPTTQSFYWFIDWAGTPISTTRATLNFKVTGLSQDYFYSRTIWPSQAAANQEASEVARKIACAFGKITGCK